MWLKTSNLFIRFQKKNLTINSDYSSYYILPWHYVHDKTRLSFSSIIKKACNSCTNVKIKLSVFTPQLWIVPQILLSFSCIQIIPTVVQYNEDMRWDSYVLALKDCINLVVTTGTMKINIFYSISLKILLLCSTIQSLMYIVGLLPVKA